MRFYICDMNRIKIIKNRSDIGAGTRGSDMGIDAIEIAAINANNDYFNNYDFVDVETENESIYRLFSQCHRQLWTNYDFKTLATNLRNIICTSPAISECHLVRYETKYDALIEHRLEETGTYLGRVSQQERDLLFAEQTQSTALYLIGNNQHPVAILAFGSLDANHFEPAKDSFFVLEFVRSLQLRLLELQLELA